MKSQILPCGFLQIPVIYKSQSNMTLTPLDHQYVDKTFKSLDLERENHRLSNNYSIDGLRLDRMFLFSILYDVVLDRPVLVSGVQKITNRSARVFSRYYVFEAYRTKHHISKMLDKIDNFELLLWDLEVVKNHFEFVFWSRDKGPLFFKRIKNSYPSIFQNWEVLEKEIELLYPNNYQGIFYLNLSKNDPLFYIRNELIFDPKKSAQVDL